MNNVHRVYLSLLVCVVHSVTLEAKNNARSRHSSVSPPRFAYVGARARRSRWSAHIAAVAESRRQESARARAREGGWEAELEREHTMTRDRN